MREIGCMRSELNPLHTLAVPVILAEIGWMGINRRVIDNRKPLLFGKGGSLKNA